MRGVDLKTVSELPGHRSIAMTMKYAHLKATHQVAAIEKLAEWNRQEMGAQAAILISPGDRTVTGAKKQVHDATPNVQ
jgi:hypothetical protein